MAVLPRVYLKGHFQATTRKPKKIYNEKKITSSIKENKIFVLCENALSRHHL